MKNRSDDEYEALAAEAEMGYEWHDDGTVDSVGRILLATTDAAVWAHHFKDQFGDVAPDEATMITWFANAIGTGQSHAQPDPADYIVFPRQAFLDLVRPQAMNCATSLQRLAELMKLADADGTPTPEGESYRIALRPYTSAGGKGQQPSDWDGHGTEPTSPPLDDIVVRDVALFRMEDMGDHFWMACYLTDGPDCQRICFAVRPGRRRHHEPRIVVESYEYPDDPTVTYET